METLKEHKTLSAIAFAILAFLLIRLYDQWPGKIAALETQYHELRLNHTREMEQ